MTDTKTPLTEDDELLPGGPEPATDADAWVGSGDPVEAMDAPDPEIAASPIVDMPSRRRTKRRKVPANLGEPVLRLPVVLKVVSVGRGIANVTATLGFDVNWGVSFGEFMGEHAYAASFRDSYLGNGFTVAKSAEKVDAENNVSTRYNVKLPRFDNGVDQIATYIADLLPEGFISDDALASSLNWRLNVQVEIPGEFALYEMQESFDLTKKAE